MKVEKMNIPADQFRPGLYRHYKGGLYKALFLVRHHETRELMVVYMSLEHGTLNVRELNGAGDAWTDSVDAEDGSGPVRRFGYVDAGEGD